jgi:hypothetical protein
MDSELIAKRRHWSSHQYFGVADIPLDKPPYTNTIVGNLRQRGIFGARDAGDIVKACQNEFESMVCFGHEAEKMNDVVVLELFVGLRIKMRYLVRIWVGSIGNFTSGFRE